MKTMKNTSIELIGTRTKVSTLADEEYTEYTFDCGLKCYIIPKKRYSAYAVFAVNFGSCDTEFIDENKNTVKFPEGTAHFLEHKMFETKDGDAFVKYAYFGGDANAYTASDRTCYLFATTDNFIENFKILLSHVTNPYITEKSVNKEKGIIAEEVKMYDDNPKWRARREMMRSLYGDSSISADPAGTVDSVMSITTDILNKAREFAYDLSNMAICICGDVNHDEVIETIKKTVKIKKNSNSKRIDVIPEDKIYKKYSEIKMDVSLPVFSIGMKFPSPDKVNGMKDFAATEILFSLLFGQSQKFYSECYNEGLFEDMGDSYQTLRNAFFGEISGTSDKPEEYFEKVKSHINDFKINGFSKEDFEIAKLSLYSDNIKDYDATDEVADSFVSFLFEGDDMFDYPETIASMTYDYVKECLIKLFDTEKMTLTVIRPI